MKIAHIAIVTPHRAGLYETTRDIVAAERRLGVDARIIDPTKEQVGIDRGVPIVGAVWAKQCQAIVNHSGLGKDLQDLQLHIIHVMHGRPYGSFLLEQAGEIPIYSYWRQIVKDERFRFFVTLWPEFMPYFSLVMPEAKLRYIPAPVDLAAWTPEGPTGHKFHGKGGDINVVCADVWRRDKDPYHIINAFGLFARRHPWARLHLYAMPQKGTAWKVLVDALGENVGEVCGFVTGLEHVYRAADLAITPHRIATRSVREALACGCTVVMAPGSKDKYTEFRAEPEDIQLYADTMGVALRYGNRWQNRQTAEDRFDSRVTAEAFIALVQEAISGG
jgi:glycosyltransferase involved in cell wall biosynthesis